MANKLVSDTVAYYTAVRIVSSATALVLNTVYCNSIDTLKNNLSTTKLSYFLIYDFISGKCQMNRENCTQLI